jgi:hypothetical protein
LADLLGTDELVVLEPAWGDPVGADECAVELEVLPPVKTNLLYTKTPITASTAAAAMRMIGFRSRCAGDPVGG